MVVSRWHKILGAFALVTAVLSLTGCTGIASGSTLFATAADNASLSTGVASGDSASSGAAAVASGDVTAGNLQLLASSNAFLHEGGEIVLGIRQIDLHVKGGDFVTVASTVANLDLSKVQNGVTVSLAQVAVDAGTYDGLRVVYSSLSRTMDDGSSLSVSEHEHERLARFRADLIVSADAVTHVLLDYAESGRQHEFFPRFEATNLADAGAVKGIVSVLSVASSSDAGAASSDSTASPVANAPVFLIHRGRVVGQALTDENGAYQVLGLVAGSYDVVAMAQGESPVRVRDVAVTASAVTTKDLTLTSRP